MQFFPPPRFLAVVAALLVVSLGWLSQDALRAAGLKTGASPGQVVLGAARFTAITPGCIRMEYDEHGAFVDDSSYLAVDRTRRDINARIVIDGREMTIDTGMIELRYKQDGKPFNAENLQATVKQGGLTYEWKPGQLSYGNLGGAAITLDMWESARPLPGGLLTKDGWCLLDDSHTALLTSDWVKNRPKTGGIDWLFFGYGHDYKSALRSLTAVGGAIPLPRRSLLGVWYSRFWNYSDADFRRLVREYAEHDYPLDVIVMDMDWHVTDAPAVARGSSNLTWTGYSWNRELLPEPEKLLKWFHDQGLLVTLNDHPAGGVRAHELCYGDFMKALGKDPAAREELAFDAGDQRYMDAFYSQTHAPLEKEGVDFWWLDWQQAPFVPNYPSLLNLAWLNQYYFKQSAKDGRRGVSFSRWAGWGDHRHPIHFSGDAATSFKMLAFEVPFTATSGNSGCFFWSHDIGGHNKGRNEESYARWCQFGACSAAMRPHSNRDPTMDRRPWTYPAWAEQSMKVSYRLRSRLFPYIYTAASRSCADSIPLVRPMYLEFPDMAEAYTQPQQYLFGDDLLVAPVVEPGTGANRLGRQAVWFPPGSEWFNFFTGERFSGGTEALVAATIEEFPLYFRGGTPVVMRPFVQRPGTAPLNEVVVRCYPGLEGKRGTALLYEDDGMTEAYLKGKTAKTRFTYSRVGDRITMRIDPAEGTFAGQVDERAYTIELPSTRPAVELLIDNQPAKGIFMPGESLNIVKVPARSIRQGCTVRVVAGDELPGTLATRAFAWRAGYSRVPSGATVKNLLVDGLTGDPASHRPPASNSVALVAAAGVGLFQKNENSSGYPDTTTLRAYVPPELDVQIEPAIRPSGTGVSFKCLIDGVAYAVSERTSGTK